MSAASGTSAANSTTSIGTDPISHPSRRCLVRGCGASPIGGLPTLHVFPKGEKLRDMWVKFVKRTRKWSGPSPGSSICSLHFKDEDFENLSIVKMGFGRRLRLRKDAVPVIYPKNATTLYNKSGRGRKVVANSEGGPDEELLTDGNSVLSLLNTTEIPLNNIKIGAFSPQNSAEEKHIKSVKIKEESKSPQNIMTKKEKTEAPNESKPVTKPMPAVMIIPEKRATSLRQILPLIKPKVKNQTTLLFLKSPTQLLTPRATEPQNEMPKTEKQVNKRKRKTLKIKFVTNNPKLAPRKRLKTNNVTVTEPVKTDNKKQSENVSVLTEHYVQSTKGPLRIGTTVALGKTVVPSQQGQLQITATNGTSEKIATVRTKPDWRWRGKTMFASGANSEAQDDCMDNYIDEMLQSMYKMQQHERLCDFTLSVSPSESNGLSEITSVKVHRLVFATVSHKIRHCRKNTIKLGGNVKFSDILHVIEFVYTGKMKLIKTFTMLQVIRICNAAAALDVTKCVKYLRMHRPDAVEFAIPVIAEQSQSTEPKDNAPDSESPAEGSPQDAVVKQEPDSMLYPPFPIVGEDNNLEDKWPERDQYSGDETDPDLTREEEEEGQMEREWDSTDTSADEAESNLSLVKWQKLKKEPGNSVSVVPDTTQDRTSTQDRHNNFSEASEECSSTTDACHGRMGSFNENLCRDIKNELEMPDENSPFISGAEESVLENSVCRLDEQDEFTSTPNASGSKTSDFNKSPCPDKNSPFISGKEPTRTHAHICKDPDDDEEQIDEDSNLVIDTTEEVQPQLPFVSNLINIVIDKMAEAQECEDTLTRDAEQESTIIPLPNDEDATPMSSPDDTPDSLPTSEIESMETNSLKDVNQMLKEKGERTSDSTRC